MNSSPNFNRFFYTEQLQSLQKACKWLNVKRGRASKYIKLINEFYKHGIRSPDHLLAYYESCEIVEIYQCWEKSIINFPGLSHKIRKAFSKGPTLREYERTDTSTNRPRNDSFVYYLAGKLLKAGVMVVAVDGIIAKDSNFDGDADIAFLFNGCAISIECKRPQSKETIDDRVKEAIRQLGDVGGIVSLDCSALIRPLEHIIREGSPEEAELFLSNCLENSVKPICVKHLEDHIIGFLLFARAPCVIEIGYSQLFSPNGKNIIHCRQDCVNTFLALNNNNSQNTEAFRFIFESLHQLISSGKVP
jgi:hypothetical protein